MILGMAFSLFAETDWFILGWGAYLTLFYAFPKNGYNVLKIKG